MRGRVVDGVQRCHWACTGTIVPPPGLDGKDTQKARAWCRCLPSVQAPGPGHRACPLGKRDAGRNPRSQPWSWRRGRAGGQAGGGLEPLRRTEKPSQGGLGAGQGGWVGAPWALGGRAGVWYNGRGPVRRQGMGTATGAAMRSDPQRWGRQPGHLEPTAGASDGEVADRTDSPGHGF